MDIVEKNVTVKMRRSSLTDIPLHALPAGHEIRAYVPGDEHAWVRIESAADRFHAISLELYRKEFGDDAALLAERQLFLLDPQGRAIGTATAWMDDNDHGQRYGRVHWVAIHPDWQRRGLAKPLMTRVCLLLQELGHDNAYLVTSTARLNAINLYLHFGFAPEINSAEDQAIWDEVSARLSN